MGRTSRGLAPTRPLVADLERAEPDALLERRAVGAVIRRAAQACRTRRSRPPIPARRRCSPACRTRAGRRWTAIYDAGARGSFDVVTLHPYTGKPKNVVRIVKIVRREMERRGDGKMPIWVTELSWPAAQGKTVQHHDFETTENGPGGRGSRRGCRCSPTSASAQDRSRLLVHVALQRGHHGQRVRLLRAAAPARRPARQRAVVDDFHAPGTSLAGLREAVRRRTPLPLTRIRCKPRAGARRLSALSWRNDRSGACWRPRSPAASAS